jgi:GntR family transcriptional regulator
MYEKIIGNNELCELFHVEKKSEFVHYKRLRLLNKEPIAIEETWMPKNLVPHLTQNHLSESVMSYLEKDYHISHDYKQISAIRLKQYEAELLNKKKNQLALAIRHHVYLLRSVLIQYTIEIQKDNQLNALSIRGKI